MPLTQFTSFVGALVERYDGDGSNDAPGSPKVEYWEFYNEPDAGICTRHAGAIGKEYAQMLAPYIQREKLQIRMQKCCWAELPTTGLRIKNGPFVREFLDDVLENGGGPHFDIMNFHQYPPFAANWGAPNGPGLVEKTRAIRAKLTEYGLDKPIMITESGMHSNDARPRPMTPECRPLRTKLFPRRSADVDTHGLVHALRPGSISVPQWLVT